MSVNLIPVGERLPISEGVKYINNAIKAFNETVVEGDSSVEAAQARVDAEGQTYQTLKERLDTKETQTNAQLAQKVNKGRVSVSDINKNLGKFDQTYMTEEFIQQMAGTAPVNAIPADGSITTDKIADGIDMLSKMAGVVAGTNLFNINAMTDKQYINHDTLVIEYSFSYNVTEYIPSVIGESYTFTHVRSVALLDADMNIISAELLDMTGSATVVIDQPYFVCDIHDQYLNDAQIQIGSEATSYEPYGNVIPGTRLQYKSIAGDRIGDGAITEDKFASEHVSRLNSYELLLSNVINCFERNSDVDITQDDFYLAKGYAAIQDLEIIGVNPDTPIKLWLLSRDHLFGDSSWNKRFIFGKKVGGVWSRLIDSGVHFTTEEKDGGVTFVTYSEGGVTVRMRVNYNLIEPKSRFIEGSTIDAEPAFIVRPECVSLTEGSGGGTAYDQSLNTTDSVSFENVTTSTLIADTLNTAGELPVGILADPPSGLLSGDAWADTTDSATHPILRVKL